MTGPDPFAPPATRPRREPVEASGDWRGMRSAFRVGAHRVEVHTAHWTGTEIYRVDGEEVVRKRNLGWHASQELQVGSHRVELEGRWYPLRPVTVDVDGVRVIDDLFPQVQRITRPVAVVVGLLFVGLAASIAWDTVRLLAAAGQE